MRSSAYRYPGENAVLLLTSGISLAILMAVSALTLHSMLVLVGLGLAFTYAMNRSRHEGLLRIARKVDAASAPALARLAEGCRATLQPGPVDLFVASNPALNAYAFGLSDPRVVVLYSGLFQVMDADEIRFILGHELGHVRLGHTWINSLLGGMAGIPATFVISALLNAAFLWWNRMCEYSADRAGLLACGEPDKAYSALIKLGLSQQQLRSALSHEEALRLIEQGDAGMFNELREVLATHPLIYHRILALRKFAGSAAFRQFQAQSQALQR